MTTSDLSDHDLLCHTTRLVGSERELTAKLVAYLAEIEERRLHLQCGFSSMFDFCVKHLHLSEGEAFRRILAARLSRRYPLVLRSIASGDVHLSALELLREHLTDDNHVDLLNAAAGKSKRAVERLIAERFPKPDVPSTIRALPTRRASASGTAASSAAATVSAAATPSLPMAASAAPKPARIEPLSATRHKVQFTAGADLREKLELALDLMSHANPSRDLAVVVERAVDLLLAELHQRKFGKTNEPKRGRPRSNAARSGRSRVANTTRREVVARDGLRCTYVAPDGRRCDARAFLELDHVEPRALGGSDDAANIRLRCRAHNQLSAEQTFGREHVDRCRNPRQQKSARERAEPKSRSAIAPVRDRVEQALVALGFRNAEARRALDEVEKRYPATTEPPPIERVLREALLVAPGC